MQVDTADERALVSWTKGHCSFTAAGLRHYQAACAQVHLVFDPQAIHTARDFCRFIRALLQANRAPAARAADAADEPTLAVQSLARRALGEVALTSATHHRLGLAVVAQMTARLRHNARRDSRVGSMQPHRRADPAHGDPQAGAAE